MEKEKKIIRKGDIWKFSLGGKDEFYLILCDKELATGFNLSKKYQTILAINQCHDPFSDCWTKIANGNNV